MSKSLVASNEKITNSQLRGKLGKLIEDVNGFIADFGGKHNNVAQDHELFKKFALENFGRIEAALTALNNSAAALDLNVLALARVSKKLFEMLEVTGLVLERIGGESAVLSKDDQLEVRLRAQKRYEAFVAEAFTEVQAEEQEHLRQIQEQKDAEKREAELAAQAQAEAASMEASTQESASA